MSRQAKFLTGSTMRHVVVMTLTGSLGLSFMFLVDFLALYWVSRLGDEALIAAIGFAGTLQFFVISISIGMMIGAVALVSRTLGMGRPRRARRIATSALTYGVGAQVVIAVVVFVFRYPLLRLSGAEGEVLEVAADFLQISLPSLPLIAAGMMSGAVLRALGDAMRSMMVTMSAGLIAVVLDPLLILYMGWGIEGAAAVIVISRAVMAVIGLYWLTRTHDILAKPALADMGLYLKPFALIAVPAIATQISTPFGNWVLVRAMADHGDSAVAGLGVVMRLTILSFGGIFALSGAIGGIIGQNAGAGQLNRVKSAYRDALLFCAAYTGVTWVLLAIFADRVAAGFGLSGEGAEIVHIFSRFAAGSFVFTGALFVSNAAFNNLGRPLWATIANWSRDGLLIGPLAFALGLAWGASGVVVAQAVANTVVGIGAGWMGWRYVKSGRGLEPRGGRGKRPAA
ncbi:MATE family efflux transporter [Thalassobius vesicularis]|uniref:MATE family efflux transporter n=1 Tax=Thalassobius vesicularis TaxID=1294297 RepID=A0A4S3M6V7_9RHOB|nr:MATE family efflux transporter [Thalassobius vesicularis]THD72899.1 MATE family efflux transporter [Thalassobius vesicularis]